MDALFWLEKLAAEVPQAYDLIGAWFHPTLASHLERAGIVTLASLVERINGVGRHWARSIQAIGPTKAARILEWLREHEAGLGISLGRHVTMARLRVYRHELEALVPPDTAVRPLEKLIVPAALEGTRGKYRRSQDDCVLAATNDYEAIVAWIRSKRGPARAGEGARPPTLGDAAQGAQASLLDDGLARLGPPSSTQRAYRKEAERFLLWAIIERKKPLSSMTQEDCTAYRDFLADPQPAARWCGRQSAERWSPLWRPFRGPLSPSAQRQAVVILGNLSAFLVSQNYLMGNPWMAVTVPTTAAPKLDPGRSVSVDQWRFIERALAELPDTPRHERLRLAMRWLYATGLRLSEIVAARLDDLTWVEYPADAEHGETLSGWWLRVMGKGGRVREVPVPDALILQMRESLHTRGLPADLNAEANCGAYLLGKVRDEHDGRIARLRGDHEAFRPEEGIATSTLYKEAKAFFRACAGELRASHRRGAHRFEELASNVVYAVTVDLLDRAATRSCSDPS